MYATHAPCPSSRFDCSVVNEMYSISLSLQIFRLMSSQGVSMDDATKASIVSAAFRKAVASSSSNIKAIDELTSRLNLAKLTHRHEPRRSSSDGALNENHGAELKLTHSPASVTARPSTQSSIAATCKRSPKVTTATAEKPHRGKKRVLSDKGKPNTNTAEEEINAKLSKEEKKEGRSKSMAPERRGKRGASLRGGDLDEGAVKRVRSTSTI